MNANGEFTREKILEVISDYSFTNGFPPTVREIGDLVGIRSTSTVHKHLGKLKSQGKIEWNPTKPRTIRRSI